MSITLLKDWLLHWEHVHVLRDRSGGDSLSRRALLVHRSTLSPDEIASAADDLNRTTVGLNELHEVGGDGSLCSFEGDGDGDSDGDDQGNAARHRRARLVLLVQNAEDVVGDVDLVARIGTSHQPIVFVCNNEYFQENDAMSDLRRRCHVLETEVSPRQARRSPNGQIL